MNAQTADPESHCENNDATNVSSRWKRFIKRYRIPKRCLFVQGLVIGESFTEAAALSMLMNYLTDIRKEKLINAAATVNILEGLSGVLSVPAAFLNQYFGCYPMILLTFQFYSMGLVLLGISALWIKLYPTPTNLYHLIENSLLCMGLFLIALAKAGSNSSCVEEFVRKQSNKTDTHSGQMFWMRAGQLLGHFLGIVLLAFSLPWRFIYGICAFVMRFCLGVFLMGTPPPTITDTPPPPPPPPLPNDMDEEEWKKLQRTNEQTLKEKRKILLQLVPLSVTFLIYGIVNSIGSTFFLEQADYMSSNMDYGWISIPPYIILRRVRDFSRVLLKICIKRLLRNRLTGPRKIYATIIRIGVGLIFTVICCATAQAVEAKRLGILVKEGLQNISSANDEDSVVPMSVFWLLPQFISLGAMEGLAGDGMEGFFESELPIDMKIYASQFTEAVIGIGTFLSVGLVSIAAKASTIGEGSSWFADTINRSHLDRFYRGLTMLCLIICFVYACVSTTYIHKRLPTNDVEEEEEDYECLAQPEVEISVERDKITITPMI